MIHQIVTGPTGSGKTALALRLAENLKIPLLNADAFQFYREIPILSNQPREVSTPILFFADRSIADAISAGDFARMVEPHLSTPHVWMGTGLYLGAGLYGLDPTGKRGTPFQGAPRTSFEMMVLDPPRAVLYTGLNNRVDQMIEQGALDEARAVCAMIRKGAIARDNRVLKAIGLSHLLEHLEGALDWPSCVELWKRDTRRLAKRQWTWLRKFCPPQGDLASPMKIKWICEG